MFSGNVAFYVLVEVFVFFIMFITLSAAITQSRISMNYFLCAFTVLLFDDKLFIDVGKLFI